MTLFPGGHITKYVYHTEMGVGDEVEGEAVTVKRDFHLWLKYHLEYLHCLICGTRSKASSVRGPGQLVVSGVMAVID